MHMLDGRPSAYNNIEGQILEWWPLRVLIGIYNISWLLCQAHCAQGVCSRALPCSVFDDGHNGWIENLLSPSTLGDKSNRYA